VFLDANADYIKVGDLVRRDAGPSECGIVMELITNRHAPSEWLTRVVNVKWLRSGVHIAYPIDLVVITK
jgi:hypothetical protein